MSAAWYNWGGATLLCGLFRLWYDGWRGPLTRAEIDVFLKTLGDRFAGTGNDPATFRAFLEQDDGREFVMLNLVKVEDGEARVPETGTMVPGIAMLKRYASPRLTAGLILALGAALLHLAWEISA